MSMPQPIERVNISRQLPKAYQAMQGLERFLAEEASIEHSLIELIKIRTSQINGCAYCIQMHTQDARKAGESEKRIYALNAWRETPYFSAAERSALALTEAITAISVQHVSEELYAEAAEHFSQEQIGEIIIAATTINAWNRIAISTGLQPD